jgi:hypothetical protein
MVAPLLLLAYRIPFNPPRQARIRKRYGNELGSFLYMWFKGFFVDFWWALRRSIIPTSDINRHEAYMSILKLSKPAE